jgi:acetyl esterase/lipase
MPRPAPPMFLAWATDDEYSDVVIGSALRLYDSWRRAGASVEAYAYATGGHNFATTKPETAADRWTDDFCSWLDASGF